MSLPLSLSARVIIVNADRQVLLLRRSPASKHYAGKWEFPGGKTDPGETFDEALLREVAEETGLTIALGRVLGAGEGELPDRRVVHLFLEGKQTGGTVRLSPEHDEFQWVPASRLPDCDLAPPFRQIAGAFAAGEGPRMR